MKSMITSKINEPLAIHGGRPIRLKALPPEFPGSIFFDNKEIKQITEVIKARSPFRYYGPKLQHQVDQLEQVWQKKFNIPYSLAVNSGTAALHIALLAMGIGPGDEVLLPGYLWVSCVSAIVRAGAIPRLVDIDPTFTMDPNDLLKKITPYSKVIMYIHMNGATGHLDKILDIAKQYNLLLLEDCSQAVGAKYNNQYLGTFGDVGTFSLQLNKNITSGEGGVIVCKSEALYHRCCAIHDVGYIRNKSGRNKTQVYELWGVGSRMSELTGAVALVQFQKLDKIVERMHHAKWKIREMLQTLSLLQFRYITDTVGDSSCRLIVIYPTQKLCKEFAKALFAEGIYSSEGSPACEIMKDSKLHWYFNISSLQHKVSWCLDGFPWSHPKNNFAQAYQYSPGTLPICDDLAARSLILSISPGFNKQDIEDIIHAFYKVYYHLCIIAKKGKR